MACDLRIAATLGVSGCQRLIWGSPRHWRHATASAWWVGRAIELMATGRTISFEEALEMHLIDYVFDRDEFWTQMNTPTSCPQTRPARRWAYQAGRLHRYGDPRPRDWRWSASRSSGSSTAATPRKVWRHTSQVCTAVQGGLDGEHSVSTA
jgi:hypothetical protein